MIILGISAFYHDSAACIVRDGKIVAAAQEERFTRIKHDLSFPRNAIEYCLQECGCSVNDIDIIAYYEKPFIKFERLLETYLSFAPKGFTSFIKSMPTWIQQKLWMREFISSELEYDGKVIFPEHHLSHAASAFYPSPFEEAAFITVDGVGEWTTTGYGVGSGNDINIFSDIKFPHSLGLLYSAFTYYTGFKVNSGEYKIMGLAPYGEPKYADLIKSEIIDIKDDGSFRLNMNYFDYLTGLKMTNKNFDDLLGGPPRKPETPVTQREMDLARSVQDVLEEVMLKMVNHVHKETGLKKFCLAGGVALNCVVNGKLLRQGPIDDLWIQPASGDAGGALGAALITWYQYLGNERKIEWKRDAQQASYLGPKFENGSIKKYLDSIDSKYKILNLNDIPDVIADLINDQKVIGMFQGRMEFGPRALGNRSIIGDARSPKMQETMNLKIKFRESFRPFAPSVINDKVSEYFEIDRESPFMLLVADVKKIKCIEMTDKEKSLTGIDKLNVKRSTIPAITHVDYSARIQTVNKDDNEFYYNIIKRFDEKYNCPVIINTSFNVRGEPIVCTPEEAFTCFMRTNMDYLLIENYLLDKNEQTELKDDIDWMKTFDLD